MAKTLQEILAENNVKANNSTQMKVSEENQAVKYENETTPANPANTVSSDNTATNNSAKKMNFQILMSSDDTSNLDVNKFQSTASTRPHIEEDIYNARCTKIDRVMGRSFEGLPEEKFCWHLELFSSSDGTELNPTVILRYYTRLAFGEKSNNYKVYGAFFGEVPARYNILECIGKECRVNVVDVQNKESGSVYSKIKDILKPKSK